MNYLSARKPEAFISVSKNRTKLYDKNVFLKDGTEFQIEIFNPTTKTIGAKIYLNGSSISSSLLIIRPGERSYLERFLDDNRKFKFETYKVENSQESKDAIKNNGAVRIEFFEERIKQTFPIYGTYYHNTGIFSNTPIPSYPDYNVLCSDIVGSNNVVYGNNSALTFPSFTSTRNSTNADKNVETGIIQKGNKSNQSFDSYYGDFNTYYSSSIEYCILPESNKPIEVKEIRQYCHNCRTRIKKATWKYCASCGEKLD